MASGPITSWEIHGETVADYFSGLQNHCRWYCSDEIKTLTPWKESYDQSRQHIKKQRHYFVNKVHLVKAMVFPVVMYGCESWTIKKAEHRRIMLLNCGAGEDSWESLGLQGDKIQSIVKEINPEYSLEGLIAAMKLKDACSLEGKLWPI